MFLMTVKVHFVFCSIAALFGVERKEVLFMYFYACWLDLSYKQTSDVIPNTDDLPLISAPSVKQGDFPGVGLTPS